MAHFEWFDMDITCKSTSKKLFVSGIPVNAVHSHSNSHVGSLVQMHHGSEVGGQGCTLCALASGEVRGHCALLTLTHF